MMNNILMVSAIFINTVSSFTCSNKIKYDEATSTISNIWNEFTLIANELFSTGNPDSFSDFIKQHCSDDYYYSATINDEENVAILHVEWNNLDEYLVSGNSDLNLPPHPSLLVAGSTRRTVANANFYFECVDDKIIAYSYYPVRITKKATLESAVIVNYVENYWTYSETEKKWLLTKSMYQTKNPFLSLPSSIQNENINTFGLEFELSTMQNKMNYMQNYLYLVMTVTVILSIGFLACLIGKFVECTKKPYNKVSFSKDEII